MLCGRKPELICPPDQVGNRDGLHLPHHLATLNLYRALAGPDFTSNLPVEQAGNNQAHHLALSWREPFIPPAQVRGISQLRAAQAIALNGLRDGVEEVLVTKGLG